MNGVDGVADDTVTRLDYAEPPARRSRNVGRRIAGFVLLLLTFPALFGFLASFESFPNEQMWRLGYATFGIACVVTGAWLVFKR